MKKIINAVMDCAGVNSEIYNLTAVRRGGLFEIAFRTDCLSYEAYVDAESAEVLGFSFEPVEPGMTEYEDIAA